MALKAFDDTLEKLREDYLRLLERTREAERNMHDRITDCHKLEREVDALKHEVPCEDCKGGIHGKYCPTCKSWRMHGNRCLDCDAEHVACPTCRGSGLKYFPAPATATFVVPPGGEELRKVIRARAASLVLEERRLMENAAKEWLAGDDSRRIEDLVIIYMPDCSEELRLSGSEDVLYRNPSVSERLFGSPIEKLRGSP